MVLFSTDSPISRALFDGSQETPLQIKAFRALRPPSELAALVACQPYDTIETEEARAIAVANPFSFLHVTRAEVDLPAGTDADAPPVYERAVANLRGFREQAGLVQEEVPCLYLYRQSTADHVQRGIVACCRVADYETGRIRRHEGTRPDKVADRARLTEALNANTGPVFMAYRDDRNIDALVAGIEQQAPLFDFSALDGVRHTGWRISETNSIERAFDAVPSFYIADGHHRSAAAARVAAERRRRRPDGEGGEGDWFLSALFPAGQLQILAYNRLISDLSEEAEAGFIAALRRVCVVRPATAALPERRGELGLYRGGKWHRLGLPAALSDNPVSRLDVSLLQDRILRPLLGIDDPTRDARLQFVSGVRGTARLEEQVDRGVASLAFTLHPVSVEEMMAVADAGLAMPPKSTWFAPKPLSGLFVHTF